MNKNARILNNILTGAIIALLTGLFVATLIGLFSSRAKAEHSIGFAAGSTRGMGATYRYLPDPGTDSPWGWQATGLPLITKNEGTVSLGGALLYRLHQGKEAMAYASLGVGGLAMWNNCEDDSDIFCEDESHWGVGFGPGIGFELRMVDNVAWAVDIPLAIMFADGDFWGVYPVPNSSLVYYW
jgi:hypothetical protein|tara:strand:+ start:3295 stop:3843 length:549 start_codon:yes stop_codon:yes gene_type:complete